MEDLKNYIPNPFLFPKSSRKRKKPELSKDWDIIVDENLIDFDVFDNNGADFTATSGDLNMEMNKYQGLMSFARYIEQNEKKSSTFPNFSTFLKPNSANSPLQRKKGKSPNVSTVSNVYEEEKQTKIFTNSPDNFASFDRKNKSMLCKASNFNMLFPARGILARSTSQPRISTYFPENFAMKRSKSVEKLPIFTNLLFLDQFIHEFMSQKEFHEDRAESLRKVKLALQELFKQENEQGLEAMNYEENAIKPRKIEPWGEIWEDKAKNIKSCSPYGHFPSYQLRTLIVKGGDDLRQELIAMQIIQKIHMIFKKAELNLFLRPYDIIVTSANSGIIGILAYFLNLFKYSKFVENSYRIRCLWMKSRKKKEISH